MSEGKRQDTKTKEINTTTVTYEEFSDIDFIPVANFFFKNALGEFVFLHTGDRAKAQQWINEYYGTGRYTVVASKITKGKVKNESGEYTVKGVSTRRGQKH